MKKPNLIIKDNLLIPIVATGKRIKEIQNDQDSFGSGVSISGLFLMATSYMESMHKEVLKYYFNHHPEKLLSDKSVKFRHEYFFENQELQLVEKLVSHFVDWMPYNELIKMFFKSLNIPKPNNSQSADQFKYYRNELIHENLKINYRYKTSSSDNIDADDLIIALNEFTKYIEFLVLEISKVYGNCTKIFVLEKLWYYTFRSQLCSNFEDYWYVDRENDSITGYKKFNHENSLSRSEKFLLSIWRSQVAPY